MNDKERAYFNELVTTKMNEIVKELEPKSQPEPQAGDVWLLPFKTISDSYIYVYKKGDVLRYKHMGSICGAWTGEERTMGELLVDYPRMTRIFSLSEYLKDKEAKCLNTTI